MALTKKPAKYIALLAGLILCLLLSACTTKIAYNYLDWAVEWYVDDLVTLNGDQEWMLTNAVEQELLWHRQTQLPHYVDLLDQLHANVQEGMATEDFRYMFNNGEKHWLILKHHTIPTITALLKSLTDSQVEELLSNLEEKNQQLEEEFVDKPKNERVQQRFERMTDRIESWTGSLNDQQVELVQRWSRKVKPLSHQWIAIRRTWQANLGQILRNHRDKPAFDKLIHDLFYNSRKYWPTWYHDAYYHNIHLTLQMMTKVTKQLTEQQKQHVLDEIKRLRNNLHELAEDI
ncbi:MAG: DUF6279 family lipoprotein [Gammaproteobacteria bacterium]|jgi:hypothetical protein